MRQVGLLIFVVFSLAGCSSEEDSCPSNWHLNKRELSSSVKVDSSQLIMSAWNPNGANVIELSQAALVGDFELSIDVEDFVWDSLVNPQFRLEVFRASEPQMDLCGVALHPNLLYCYVGNQPNDYDMRLMNDLSGSMRIKREGSLITCSASFGDVAFSYSKTRTDADMGVRLVLGSTSTSTGKVEVTLSQFVVTNENTKQGTYVRSDLFECESW